MSIQYKKPFWKKFVLLFVISTFFFTSTMTFFPKKSEACCSCMTETLSAEIENWVQEIIFSGVQIVLVMLGHKLVYMKSSFWANNLGVAMRDMAEQLSGVAMQQTLIVGQFIDAQHQMETQQILQTLQARVHKDYHPSVGMCEFASNAKSLAESERKGELNQVIMVQRAQERLLGNSYTSAARGPGADNDSRLQLFTTRFCDLMDHNAGLDLLCENGGNDPDRLNKDIDYNRTVDYPFTLDMDFYDSDLTDNEAEVLALASNLYGHDVPLRFTPQALETPPASNKLTGPQGQYMDQRADMAKLSVAQNSFAAITGMKSSGSPGAKEFIDAVFEGLDMEGGFDEMIGELPSYHAQMEILTKKLTQNPDFYTNLYDKPANVERKGVALQAIGLMQKFDLFKSHLRNEANLSVILELSVSKMQKEIENRINKQEEGGETRVRN